MSDVKISSHITQTTEEQGLGIDIKDLDTPWPPVVGRPNILSLVRGEANATEGKLGVVSECPGHKVDTWSR